MTKGGASGVSRRIRLAPFGVGVWKGILALEEAFWGHASINLGNGECTSFWHDSWITLRLFKEIFPSLFVVSMQKDSKVGEILSRDDHGNHGNLRFSCRLRGDLAQEEATLRNTITVAHLQDSAEDMLKWGKGEAKPFSVSRCFRVLKGSNGGEFPSKVLWKNLAPQRLDFLLEVWWKGINTLDRLKQRGWILANRCILCEVEEESINHLFLYCEAVNNLWRAIWNLVDLHWVMPSTVREHLLAWRGIRIGKSNQRSWNSITHASFWVLWMERNRRIFKVKHLSPTRLHDKLWLSLYK